MNNIENIAYDENKRTHSIYILILILLVGITFYVLFKGGNLQDIYITIGVLDNKFIILGLLSAIMFICCEALVLKLLLYILGEDRPYLQILKYSFVGFYFSSITPSASGGQPMQIYYMKKDGISISKSTLSILVTVVIYQITMVFYGMISIVFNHRLISETTNKIYPLICFGVIINILTIGFILGSIFYSDVIYKLVCKVLNILKRLGIVDDIEKIKTNFQKQIREYKQGARLICNNIGTIVMIFIISFIQLTSIYAITFFVYRGFGLFHISLWRIIAMQSILNIAVSSLPLPGGVGASEGVFMLLFKTIFPKSILAAAMLISRGISYYALLIISGGVLFFMNIFNLKSKVNIK